MKEFSMIILLKGKDAMQKIADDNNIPVRFGVDYMVCSDECCKVYSDTRSNAAILRSIYNRDIRELWRQT